MATEKKMNEQATETASAVKPTVAQDMVKVDPFAMFAENDDGAVDEGVSTVFTPNVVVSRRPSVYKGEERWSYAIGVSVPIGDDDDVEYVDHVAFLNPYPRHAGNFKVLDKIFGKNREHPLEIVRTEFDRDSKKQVTYKLRVTRKNKNGIIVSCQLRPTAMSGGDTLENIYSVLRYRGELV